MSRATRRRLEARGAVGFVGEDDDDDTSAKCMARATLLLLPVLVSGMGGKIISFFLSV